MSRSVALALALCIAATASTGCLTAIAAFQPENVGGSTIVITTFDTEGKAYERVLTPLDDDGTLVVSANHWPRAWYRRALENPDVRVRHDGETRDYRAVPVSDEERDRLLDHPGFPKLAYVFTGFAPRQFLRLDPK